MVSDWLSERGGVQRRVTYILKQEGGKKRKTGQFCTVCLAKKMGTITESLEKYSPSHCQDC